MSTDESSHQFQSLVLAYPELEVNHLAQIQSIRAKYDQESFGYIAPHLTLVMPQEEVANELFLMATNEIAMGTDSISFCLNRSSILSNLESGEHFLVLVPDRGYDEILQLHLALYRRLGLSPPFGDDFVPHLTVGFGRDREMLQGEADRLSHSALSISGSINSIVVANWRPGEIKTVDSFLLSKA